MDGFVIFGKKSPISISRNTAFGDSVAFEISMGGTGTKKNVNGRKSRVTSRLIACVSLYPTHQFISNLNGTFSKIKRSIV